MTVETVYEPVTYSGDGFNTTFDYSFVIPGDNDEVIYKTDTDGVLTQLLDTEYTITGIGEETGGTVTYPLSGDPLTADEKITIARKLEYTQPTNLRNQETRFYETMETMVDRSVMQIQQLSEAVNRSVKIPISDTGSGDDLVASITAARVAAEAAEAEAEAAATEAKNWANAAEDTLVPEGNGVDDYSAMHWAKKAEHHIQRIFVSPKDYGAIGNGVANDTNAVNSCINAVIAYWVSTGRPVAILVDGIFKVDPITIPNTTLNLYFYGISGANMKATGDMYSGFIPVGNQSHLIRVNNQTSGQSAAFRVNGVNFYGDDYELENGLLYLHSLSQATIQDSAFLRAKGAGIKAIKMEDVAIHGCNFGYLGSNTYQGGIDFEGESGLKSNIIRIFNNRFEWIDGAYIRTSGTYGAINGIDILNNKFEINRDDTLGYGTTRNNYPIFDFSGGDVADRVRIAHNWMQSVQEADTILKAKKGTNIEVAHNKLALSADKAVSLFKLTDGTNPTVDVEDFRFYGNSLTESSAGIANMDFSFINESSYPVLVELPYYYRNQAVLSKTPPNFYDSYNICWYNRFVPDPDPTTDPCLSVANSVVAHEGSSSVLLALLSSDFYLDKLRGIVGSAGQKFLRLGVRAKKAGNVATAVIQIYNDTTYITQINLDNTTWEIKEAYLNLRDLDLTKNINIKTKSGNQSDHICYVDGVYVEFTDYIKRSAAPTTGTFEVGDRVYNTTPAAAGTLGWVCVTAGQAEDTEWQSTTAYTVGNLVYNGANVYVCVTAGTSAGSGGPTGTGTAITDGTAEWDYVNTLAVFKTFGTIEA